MSKKRGKNLSDNDILAIVELIDGWEGEFSWDLLINSIERRLFVKYTRQALYKHGRIKLAFHSRKISLASSNSDKQVRFSNSEAQVLYDKCKRLEAENVRIMEENRRLLEQFVIWAYNAHTKGCDEKTLNRPLPKVNRDQT